MPVSVATGDADEATSQPFDLEALRLRLSALTARWSRRVTVETLRPLPVFLGIHPVGLCLSPGAFTPPVRQLADKTTPEKVQSRLRLNLAYFLTNYVLLVALVAIVVALMHPGMLLVLGLVWSFWSLHTFLIKHELVVFGVQVHSLLTIQQRFYGLLAMTTLVVLWKCLVPALTVIVLSTVLVLTHAVLRDPKHIEMSATQALGVADDSDDEMDSGDSSGSEVLVERASVRGDTV